MKSKRKLDNSKRNFGVTFKITTLPTICPCGELWLVVGGGVIVSLCGDTLLPITTHHIGNVGE